MDSPTPGEVRNARDKAGLTQPQAAAKVGVHWTTWQRWELGKTSMPEAAWEYFKIQTKRRR